MSYIINNSRGQVVAVIADGTINTTATSLALVGRAVNGYGESENENYVFLLENFANGTPPLQPILGQLWYNSDTNTLNTYTSTNAWVSVASEPYVQAQKISPIFSGVPQAPTAPPGTGNAQIATTGFVTNSVQLSGVPTAPTAPAGTGNAQIATTGFVTNSVQLGGVPTAPTAAPGTDTAQLATTAFVTFAVNNKTTVVTPPYGDNTGNIATTAFVQGEKLSPTFTGAPRAPTAAIGTANTQIATTGFVYSVTGNLGTISQQNANAVNITGGSITGISPIPIASGGTSATSADDARTNLGLGTMAVQNDSDVTITGGNISGITPLSVSSGGTGAGTAPGARINLGLGTIATQNAAAVAITGGTVVGITDLAVADGGTGASNAPDARQNLGLGSIATQNSNSVNITGGDISGITPLPVSSGGTGANNPAQARINLGLGTGASTNVGTIAVQDANAVAITGGSISGITPLAVISGGTGSATAGGALTNLGAVPTTRTIFAGAGLAGTGALSADVTLSIAPSSNGFGQRYVSPAPPTGGQDGDIWYQI